MRKKIAIHQNTWTSFWNTLGIYVKKRQRFLKNYHPNKDFRLLQRIGIDREAVEKVFRGLSRKGDPLLFHKFSRFFRRDPETIRDWLRAKTRTEAFLKMYRQLLRRNIKRIRTKFDEIRYLLELDRKGEGRHYEAKYRNIGSIKNIAGTRFSKRLNISDERAQYKAKKIIKLENGVIVCIEKDTGKSIYKFVKVQKDGARLRIHISADSNTEFDLIRNVLAKWFKVYIDTPQIDGDLSKMIEFLKKGFSDHFELTQVTYFEDRYKITISPKYSRRELVAQCASFKKQLDNNFNFEDRIARMRILHKQIKTRGQVFVDILSTETSGIIGAVMLKLNDRKLNKNEREQIKSDFNADFDIPLNSFINRGNLSDEDIYKKILQTVPRRANDLVLRNDAAITIYKRLLDNEIILPPAKSKEVQRFCTNRSCRLSFQIKWSGVYCRCGQRLITSREITLTKINDESLLKYILKAAEQLGFKGALFKRRLLSKPAGFIEIRVDNKSVILYPISKSLTDNQLEIARLRYPNLLLVSSNDDVQNINGRGPIDVMPLYELIFELDHGNKNLIVGILKANNREQLARVRNLATEAEHRILDNKFYISKNRQIKNYGAELFEAHCSLLLKYIFGNSIWLGAKERGKALPDGITALPILNSSNGCFIWDAKFTEKKTAVLGKDKKNRKYVTEAKKNKTLINNGGLKGFVFISNKDAPKSFKKKFKRIIGNKRVKVIFLRSKHLSDIYKHFKANEEMINHSSAVKRIFVDSMVQLFFQVERKKKFIVIDDNYIKTLLSEARSKYSSISQGKRIRI